MANIITASRIIISIALLFFPALSPEFYALYLAAGITDMLDGTVARKTGKAGAEALYISACSSEETIAYYKAMGSELTSNPIKEMAEAEPCDLQMICPVKD